MNIRIVIRIILSLILLGTIFVLLWLAIVPNGEIFYRTDFSDDSFFIRKFSPDERIEKSEGQISLIANPVYFNLRTPRTFDEAQFRIRYKNDSDSLIEFGPLVDKDLWRYQLYPVENNLLEQIDLVWPKLEWGGLSLWQRPGLLASSTFDNVKTFIDQPPSLDKIAVYNYDPKWNYVLSDYQADDFGTEWPYSLRGDWQTFVYIDNEVLNLSLDVLDLNQNLDPDQAELRLYYGQELLATEYLDDDGLVSDLGQVSSPRTLSLEQAGLPQGVYKIEFRAGSDLVSRSIISSQQKFVFNSQLNLHKDNNENIEIWTDSQSIQAQTIYPESYQAIQAGEAELDLADVYQQIETQVLKASSSQNTARIVLAKDGVQISGEGTFALSSESWFNPKLKKVSSNLDLNAAQIDYVLADYQVPESDGDWRQIVKAVILQDAYREDGQYSFLISAPALKEGSGRKITIDSIEATLRGRTLWQKIKEILNVEDN